MIRFFRFYLKKMKTGMMYKRLMLQTYEKSIKGNPELITGAKIKYNAQSTFHTLK